MEGPGAAPCMSWPTSSSCTSCAFLDSLCKAQVAKNIGEVPFHEVDAHNVVPVWEASDKREYGARTIRSKIHKKLPEFLKVPNFAPESQEPLLCSAAQRQCVRAR